MCVRMWWQWWKQVMQENLVTADSASTTTSLPKFPATTGKVNLDAQRQLAMYMYVAHGSWQTSILSELHVMLLVIRNKLEPSDLTAEQWRPSNTTATM